MAGEHLLQIRKIGCVLAGLCALLFTSCPQVALAEDRSAIAQTDEAANWHEFASPSNNFELSYADDEAAKSEFERADGENSSVETPSSIMAEGDDSKLESDADRSDSKDARSELKAVQSRTLLDVDRDLYLNLIKLSRFNIKFHLEANAHQKWRAFTYPLGRETGTAVSFAGTLIDLRQQAKNLNRPAGISRSAIRDAIACNITGSAISGCSSALELAQNAWVMHDAKKRGFSPRESVAFVKNIVARVDTLLDERKRFTELETTVPRRRVRELENALLARIRQQLLFEFRTWSCHSRDQAWRENTFFAIDSAQSFLRMTASVLARKALTEPDLAGKSIVCALVANSVATINPIFRNLVGHTVGKYQAVKLAKEFPAERPAMPVGLSLAELKALQAKHQHKDDKPHEELLTSALLLSERSEKIDLNLDRETKEVARYRQVAQQQSISGPLIGLTGVTGSTLSAVAFFRYREEPRTAIKVGFPGRITSATGQAYALLNTPYTLVTGMRRKQKLRARGQHPEQILADRLENLDRFESQVRALRSEP